MRRGCEAIDRQVGFARVIERTAAWAAGASPAAPLREQLVALISGAT